MSALGKFTKQPIEVERYSIQYLSALDAKDELKRIDVIASASKTARKFRPNGNYFVSATDTDVVILASATIMLPNVATEGNRVFIANTTEFDPVTIQALGVPITFENIDATGNLQAFVITQTTNYTLFANETAEFIYTNGGWVESFYVRANRISKPGDQRVRFLIGGGENLNTYSVECTVSTQDGRVLQDEFQVKIKEN